MDIVSKEIRSRMMSGIKGKNTQPEIMVRKLLHAQGFRYRLHVKSLPGKPDIVLKSTKSVYLYTAVSGIDIVNVNTLQHLLPEQNSGPRNLDRHKPEIKKL